MNIIYLYNHGARGVGLLVSLQQNFTLWKNLRTKTYHYLTVSRFNNQHFLSGDERYALLRAL